MSNARLRVIIVKPGKYGLTGHVERFYRNSTGVSIWPRTLFRTVCGTASLADLIR